VTMQNRGIAGGDKLTHRQSTMRKRVDQAS
jgi:hypothetical protein